MGLTKEKEREFAKILYTTERLDQKVIAARVGVSEKTIKKWIDVEGWDKLRKSLLTTKDNQITYLYNQLEALNIYIAERPPLKTNKGEVENLEKKGIPTNAESDTISKITSSIQRLEVETSLGEYVEVGRNLLPFIQSADLEHAKLFKTYMDAFIISKLKN